MILSLAQLDSANAVYFDEHMKNMLQNMVYHPPFFWNTTDMIDYFFFVKYKNA